MKDEDICAVLNEIDNRFSEWLEMAGGERSNTAIYIMAQMILQEREKNEYYKRFYYENCTRK